jgi:putative transposase
MKNSRLSDSQIIAILKQAKGDSPPPELCREHGISSANFYKWRSKFGGMENSNQYDSLTPRHHPSFASPLA